MVKPCKAWVNVVAGRVYAATTTVTMYSYPAPSTMQGVLMQPPGRIWERRDIRD